MSSLPDPEWYDTLKNDQPFRTRTFKDEHAAGIVAQAMAPSARKRLTRRRQNAAAVLFAAAVCALLVFTNMPERTTVPSSTVEATGTAGAAVDEGAKPGQAAPAIDPKHLDTLLNPPYSDEPKKRILLQKRLGSGLLLIYSEQPEADNPSAINIDLLQWKDFHGDHSVGTGLDGWFRIFSTKGAESGNEIMSGVSYEGNLMSSSMTLFAGELTSEAIAGIRVTGESGAQWKADIFPRPDGTRAWYADTLDTVRSYTIEALDENGDVISAYPLSNP